MLSDRQCQKVDIRIKVNFCLVSHKIFEVFETSSPRIIVLNAGLGSWKCIGVTKRRTLTSVSFERGEKIFKRQKNKQRSVSSPVPSRYNTQSPCSILHSTVACSYIEHYGASTISTEL